MEDLTANLPDDVLCEVFDHIPSLPHKFKLAAVNQKFRRCMATVFRKPHSLVFNRRQNRVNGHAITVYQWPQAAEALAQMTQFNRIRIQYRYEYINLWNDILTKLCNADCLQKLTQFEFNSHCKAVVLERFLEMCPKLSNLKLGVYLFPHNSGFMTTKAIGPINLGQALNKKPLTELTLQISRYQQSDVVVLFDAIKQNTLQKMNFSLRRMNVDLGHLMQELAGGAWAALREIRFTSEESTFTQVDQFCALLPNLPHLIKCSLVFYDEEVSQQQMVGTAVSLLNHTDRANPLRFEYLNRRSRFLTGCQVINFVQQVRNKHRALQVNFGADGKPDTEWLGMNMKMELVHGNVTFVASVSGAHKCNDADCVHCRSFYPTFLSELAYEVERREEDMHLGGYFIDRCRIDSVVEHINWWWNGRPELEIEALTAVLHENQHRVVITFESENGDQFQTTVNCAPCFNTACIVCRVV